MNIENNSVQSVNQNETPIQKSTMSEVEVHQSITPKSYTQSTIQNGTPNKKSKKTVLIVIILLLIAIIGLGIYFGTKTHKTTKKIDKTEEETTEIEQELSLQDNSLQSDFENGTISVDEYVSQSIYKLFDNSKLEDKYANSYVSDNFNFDEYVDQMSDETLKLYYETLNLSNVEFVDYSSTTTKQLSNNEELKEQVNTLNKVYLSKSGKFMLWYTDTGDNKVSLEKIQHDADILDEAVNKYKDDLGLEYKYYSTINTNSERYSTQANILKNNNIDEKYLSESMQVYYFKFSDSSVHGVYVHNNGLEKDNIKIRIVNIISPDSYPTYNKYIMINSNVDYIEDSTLYHELFHHYENYCIDSDGITSNKNYNKMFGETASQWVAAKYNQNNDKNNPMLNLNALNYSLFMSNIFTDAYEKHGFGIGYVLFPLAYNIEQNSSQGKQLIFDAIHQTDSFEYMNNQMTKSEKNAAVKDTAIHMLKQDYTNNNLLLPENESLSFDKTITKAEKTSIPICGAGIYYINYKPKTEDNLKVTISPQDGLSLWASVYVLGYKNDSYELVKEYEYTQQTIISLSDYKKYDDVVIIVINNDFKKNNNFDIEVAENKETKTSFENYKVKIDVSLTTYGIETTTHSEGVVDELHQREYLKTTSQVLGTSLNIESYSDFNNNIVYINNPFSGKWEKSQNAATKIDLAFFANKLLSTTDTTKISDNKYSVKLDKSDLNKLSTDSSILEYNFTGDIYVMVYTKDDIITKLEYDFSDIIEEFDSMKATIEFSDYNNAGSIEIPDEVKNIK